jgi:hypothetical protein
LDEDFTNLASGFVTPEAIAAFKMDYQGKKYILSFLPE